MTQALLARRAVLLGTGALALTSRDAGAQPAVDRLARIVVGAAPGGGTDTIARLLAEQLSGRYAPQVIVENRSGASSRLAAEAVKAAAPDGTTMLVCPLPVLALYPHVLPRTTRYDPLADFTPAATPDAAAAAETPAAEAPAADSAWTNAWGSARPVMVAIAVSSPALSTSVNSCAMPARGPDCGSGRVAGRARA